MGYLRGLLTLHHSLYHPNPDQRSTPTKNPDHTTTTPNQGSRYPFVALYTSTFPPEGLKVLQARGIQAQWVPNETPPSTREYAQDPRFAETWTKLVAFSLEKYERVVRLDGDILVRRNMDELMEIELDSRASLEQDGDGSKMRVFAAAHACACNPMKKSHYPANWYVFLPVSTMPCHAGYQTKNARVLTHLKNPQKLRLHNPTRNTRPSPNHRATTSHRRWHAQQRRASDNAVIQDLRRNHAGTRTNKPDREIRFPGPGASLGCLCWTMGGYSVCV